MILSKNCNYQIIRRLICFVLMIAIFMSQINLNAISVKAEEKDYVKITAVSPNYYRSYTTEMTFTATVEYRLSSCDHGIVYLGFNTNEPHRYSLYAEQEVDKGSGTVTLQATVTPVDWSSYWKAGQHVLDLLKGYSSMETDFKIYANLSEYPHNESWEPLTTYEYPLEYLTTDAEIIEPELFWDKTNGHDDENDDQDLTNPEGEAETIYKKVKFNNSLEDLCSQTASTTYNPQLAYMLMTLASGAYYKQCAIENYDSLGFNESDYHTYNYYKEPEDRRYNQDSVAYCIGEKKTWDGRRMVLITIRGSFGTLESMSPDWKSNFNLGEAETGISWHEGFETAANEVLNSLKSLYGDKLPTDNTFYVVTGHSRGAGVANLLSVLLSDNGVPKLNVYDYNFACPDVARNIGMGWNWVGDHDNMFNIGYANDPVTWIPGSLGNLLGNASDTTMSIVSFLSNQNLNVSGADNSGLATPMTDWGKFGRSYWVSSDWNQSDKSGISFDSHAQENYMNYLQVHSGDSGANEEMVTWEGVALRSTVGKSLLTAGVLTGVAGLVWLVLCPVDVEIKDSDGNVLASVVGEEINYHDSSLGEVVVLIEKDHKLIFVKDRDDVTVELKGTGNGTMDYAVVRTDMLTDELGTSTAYENVKISDGKSLTDHVLAEVQEDGEIISELKVVNKLGNDIAEVQEDGQEVAVKGSFFAKLTDHIWLLIILAIVIAVLIIFVLILLSRRRKSKKTADMYDLGITSTEGFSSGQMSGGFSGGLGTGETMCSCGTLNPPGVRKCIVCGKKLKKRR